MKRLTIFLTLIAVSVLFVVHANAARREQMNITQLDATTVNAVIDGTSTAADVFLNVLVDDADHDVGSTACNFLFSGTITITWTNLGDY